MADDWGKVNSNYSNYRLANNSGCGCATLIVLVSVVIAIVALFIFVI